MIQRWGIKVDIFEHVFRKRWRYSFEILYRLFAEWMRRDAIVKIKKEGKWITGIISVYVCIRNKRAENVEIAGI